MINHVLRILFVLLVLLAVGLKFSDAAASEIQTRHLLVDVLEEKPVKFAKFLKKHRITEITFYTAHMIPAKSQLLKRHITAARNRADVKRIGFAVASERELARILDFASEWKSPVDMLWLEYEFWNHRPRDFGRAKELLVHMRQNVPIDVIIGAYIGWTTEAEMHQLIPLVNRLYIHSYVDRGTKLWTRVESRLHMLDSYMGPVEDRVTIMPIFSAEWAPVETCDSGKRPDDGYCFLGSWISKNGITKAEEMFLEESWMDSPPLWKVFPERSWRHTAVIDGYVYYNYSNMKRALDCDCRHDN